MSTPAKPADAALVGKTAMKHLAANHPGRSVDELLTHPSDAIEICRLTNLSIGRQMTHSSILRALLNARKRGDLKP